MSDKIVQIFTGNEFEISRIKHELEETGINCLVKNGFQQGVSAGFFGGVPSAIDLFVDETDLDRALEVVQALTQE